MVLRQALVTAVLLTTSTSIVAQVDFEQHDWFYEFPLASTNVLPTVPPPSSFTWDSIFLPPGISLASAKRSPFHVYHPDFHRVIGEDPRLALVLETEGYYSAHEAPVYHEPTQSFFFCSNAGAPLGFSGAENSNRVFKISLDEVESSLSNKEGQVYLDETTGDWKAGNATLVEISGEDGTEGRLVNVNGGTNYRDQIVFLAQGRGEEFPPTMTLVNPYPPYNSTVILNNYFGRQFNSLNDVALHRGTGDLFFTDPDYGNSQDFRPTPDLPLQVYRWNQTSGLVSLVADEMVRPNGIVFSPDETKAYVADTGLVGKDRDPRRPATIYEYNVDEQGNWSDRRTFAFINTGVPDGLRCDESGNVYAGTGDGVTVFNPQGVLLGKIFVGSGSANFQWAGPGRMVILAETKVYVAKLLANGDPVWK
ncbi:hypothetical protein HD553DRAFT_135773 [Filobasidium floriforme]|uniref:uncharacterized protein n=1 Tax=Filobasidium floriforme TaxID=5210 RepID=UPI001E8DBB2E|nr:uncharacterized protein HD553DRAFT_135773 [Filobasidium floriforme]KAH8079386.1 hypothetical protein HD553DRAFT_135773 [Filobasidium floriforme]